MQSKNPAIAIWQPCLLVVVRVEHDVRPGRGLCRPHHDVRGRGGGGAVRRVGQPRRLDHARRRLRRGMLRVRRRDGTVGNVAAGGVLLLQLLLLLKLLLL